MLCMSKTSKMQKEHTQKFLLITTIIFTKFSIRKKFWKALSLSFAKLFQIENPLNIKEVMSKNMFNYSYYLTSLTPLT